MPVTDEDIREITAAVWLATLGLPIDDQPVAFGAADRRFTGCVVISGAWAGAVTVDVSEDLARRAASAMFDVAEDDLADEEVRDALGELTNMTGGNIKTLIEGVSRLSLPAVTEGREYTVSIPGSAVVNRVELGCVMEPLRVSVLEHQVVPVAAD